VNIKAILAALSAFGIGLLAFFARKSGRDAERADNAQAAIKDARKANAIEQDVSSLTDTQLDERLRPRNK